MSINLKSIHIGQGLGELEFGMRTGEVKALLGQADEEEQFSYTDSDEDLAESWHYDELGLSISFDEQHDWRLVSIAVSTDEYQLEGVELVNMEFDKVIDLLEGWKLGDIEYEDLSSEEDGNAKLLTIDEASINFWFEDNELSEIQWGPLYKNEDVVWPRD